MTVTDWITILTALGLGAFIPKFMEAILNRRQSKLARAKAVLEADKIKIEGEIMLSEYFKKELAMQIEDNKRFKLEFQEKMKEYDSCRASIRQMQVQYDELQRQLNMLKLKLGIP